MVALRLLLSQAGRHSLSKPHSASYLAFQRCLSSSIPPPSDDSSGSEPTIQVVSYPTKSRDESNPSNETESQQPQSPPRRPPPPTTQEVRTGWTREDIRYVKDVPSISPVSYPARVAPLPEDKVEVEGEEKDVEENEEMGRERRRRIESQNRLLSQRSIRFAMQEEKVVVPFPMLLKAQSKKKENKPILDLMDAIKQVKATAKANFDETVEAHVRLAIPPRKTELIVRGTMNLPHGDKKAVRVAFFAEGADADDARASGADVVGGLELIEEIASSGKIDADKCFATRQLMPRLFKISKILNHQGLMPNPKQGTVTNDVARAVQEAKQGHIKFKMDNTSNVHVGLGKVSLKEELLRQNVSAFVSALLLAKPAGLKKTSKFAGYVNAFHLCSTMGPAFPISIQSLSRALDQYGKVGH